MKSHETELGSEAMSPKYPVPVTRLMHEARRPDADERPSRCRAIIFNPEGTKVLGIARHKPGREPYVVYPGGGLEDIDATAVATVWRELYEELHLTETQLSLTGDVLEQGEEFFYLGVADAEFEGLTIGGPEAESDEAILGTYTPGWFDADRLDQVRMFPEEISAQVQNAVHS